LENSLPVPERTVVQAEGAAAWVVAQTAVDCGEVLPSPSKAATEKQYWVAGASPVRE
jgi:hypothetical protein